MYPKNISRENDPSCLPQDPISPRGASPPLAASPCSRFCRLASKLSLLHSIFVRGFERACDPSACLRAIGSVGPLLSKLGRRFQSTTLFCLPRLRAISVNSRELTCSSDAGICAHWGRGTVLLHPSKRLCHKQYVAPANVRRRPACDIITDNRIDVNIHARVSEDYSPKFHRPSFPPFFSCRSFTIRPPHSNQITSTSTRLRRRSCRGGKVSGSRRESPGARPSRGSRSGLPGATQYHRRYNLRTPTRTRRKTWRRHSLPTPTRRRRRRGRRNDFHSVGVWVTEL